LALGHSDSIRSDKLFVPVQIIRPSSRLAQ